LIDLGDGGIVMDQIDLTFKVSLKVIF
jgi:hypothetical protein